MNDKNEIVLYQLNNSIRLDVRVENETVWLTQAQMVELFETTKQNVSLHIGNIFKEGELIKEATVKDYLTVQNEGNRSVQRTVSHYNLDVIISVGYRVRSQRGTQFRQWATQILRNYILKNYAVNQRFEHLEYRMTETEKKIDFFVHRALPPEEGILFDGQVFDAYKFAADLIKSAKSSIVLIDNYVDESVLFLLSKRAKDVPATIYTKHISPQFQLELNKHNQQYPPVTVKTFTRSHDRFLILDDELYHIGASLKDLGKKWFAFAKMKLN
ncbi:MAG: virulence RhuM family protein, partial [Candidatus Symbiothrix sp.]|nr:virulence RhuM family protein [Candidatus Symbiothrix sp.]